MLSYEEQTKKLLTRRETLEKRVLEDSAVSDTETAQDIDTMDGQTSFFDKKHNHYSEA